MTRTWLLAYLACCAMGAVLAIAFLRGGRS